MNERRQPYSIGEEVSVPMIEGHISSKKSWGKIIALTPPYAKVQIIYGRQKGTWDGAIHELTRHARIGPERRK